MTKFAQESGIGALLGMRHAQRFCREGCPREPVLVHGPPSRVEALARLREFSDVRRLFGVRYGKIMAEHAGGYAECDAETALARYRSEEPIQVSNIGLGIPVIHRWCQAIAKELGLPPVIDAVRANAFVAGAPSIRFPLHFDATDVIVIQLLGEKRWRLAPNPDVPFPMSGCGTFTPVPPGKEIRRYHYASFDRPTRTQNVVLKPGTALYVPRGYWHGTETLSPSVSVTFVLGNQPALEVLLDRLRHVLSRKPEWNEPAFGVRGSVQAQEHARQRLEQLTDEFASSLGPLDPRELLEGFRLRHSAFGDGRVTFARTAVSARLVRDASGARIDIGKQGARVALGPDDETLARWALGRTRPFALADALSHANLLQRPMIADLLARLVRAGLLSTRTAVT